jgi:hypothetical protein
MDVLKVSQIDQFHRSAVMGVAAGIKTFAMFREPSLVIIRDAGVVTSIPAVEDVDVVLVHAGYFLQRNYFVEDLRNSQNSRCLIFGLRKPRNTF